MVMDEGSLALILGVMGHRVHQDGEAGLLPGGYRDGRDAQHLRQPVQVDLHAPFFYDIHHVEGQYHRFPQFNELQGKIEVPFQAGGVHYVDDHVHLPAHDTFPGYRLFHGVGSQAVGAGQVDETKLLSLIGSLSFFFLNGDSGPVAYL